MKKSPDLTGVILEDDQLMIGQTNSTNFIKTRLNNRKI